MSEYGGHRRHGHTREPEYVETEETFISRGAGSGNRDLVLRQRDDYDDGYRRGSYRDYDDPPRRARSSHYHGREHDDYDDYDYDRPRRRRSRYDDDSYYSDDYDRPARRERRKSKAGEILEDLGLGGVAAAVTNTIRRSRSQSRRRRGSNYSDDDSRDGYGRSRSHETRKKWQQAAKAAVITGVIEAVRSRNEPGSWTGGKGQRVATAALASAGVDGFLDRDPDHKSKRHIVESVVSGLAVNRIANGPREASSSRGRSRSRSRSVVDRLRSRSRSILGRGRSRSRSRSQSRGGERGRSSSRFKEVAALGGAAAVGKAIWDRVRSKSRGRLRRDASVSSDDSYVPSHRQRYQPGPVVDQRGPPGGTDFDRGRPAEANAEGGVVNRARSNSASSEDTEDLKQSYKKTRGKELLTAALASVATIHAAHGVYSSMVASENRHKKVMEGEMTPETARKLKSKNMLQDAAAVGIAALSIKSAFSEWKEMNEKRKEKHEIYARRRKRIKARERRERELRTAGGYGGYPGYGGGFDSPGGGGAADYYRGGPTYGDQNPYNSYSNIPPPPVGAPPNRYS